MQKNFTLPGRQNRSVQGKPLPRTAGEGDSPWYVPGLRRRRIQQDDNQLVEFTLSYEGDDVHYYNMKLTYAMVLS